MQEIIPKGSCALSKSESPADMAAALNNLITHPDCITKMSHIMLEQRDEVLISNRIKLVLELFYSIIKSWDT